MDNKRLLECLEADFARLREAATAVDSAAVVPSCPDWTVAELGRHVGAVYLHKVECMRLGQPPQPWPPDELNDEDPISLLDRSHAALVGEFAARDPQAATFTWYDPDQTVGFWIRRMAQETVIHRVDAELAAGLPHAPVPDDLAHDGIDEILVTFVEFMVHKWAEEFTEVLAPVPGTSVRLETPSAAWLVRLSPESVEVRVSDVDQADAVVRGGPTELLLWLWNRADDDAVTITGDAATVDVLRRVLEECTQ
ncbi:MAG TPA: maleylpyruvate isomerase family mycothiol-dependent enzyme [Micromonosporaceae bacterium]